MNYYIVEICLGNRLYIIIHQIIWMSIVLQLFETRIDVCYDSCYINYISEFAIHHSKPLNRYTWRCSSTFMIPTCIVLHQSEVWTHWSYAAVWFVISTNAISNTLLPLWNAPGFIGSHLWSYRCVEAPDGCSRGSG